MAYDDNKTVIKDTDMRKADLILYGVKFPWDDKDALIQMLGQQAATSTTSTPSNTKINLKKGTISSPGALAETFVADSYWQKNDMKLYYSLKRAVKEQIKISIWRMDFNEKRDDPETPGSFIVPATYAQAYPNGVPDTEAVNNLLHSNITYNIEGDSQEGILKQAELDPDLYKVGLQMYNFAHNTDVGGTADPQPTPMEDYLKKHGASVITPNGNNDNK